MPDSDTVSLKRPGTWPRRARLALEAIVILLTNAYVMARSRAAGSPFVRSVAAQAMVHGPDGRPKAADRPQWHGRSASVVFACALPHTCYLPKLHPDQGSRFMTDSDLPDARRPGNWPRPLRLALDSIVTVWRVQHVCRSG
jgi:hypothetical protein